MLVILFIVALLIASSMGDGCNHSRFLSDDQCAALCMLCRQAEVSMPPTCKMRLVDFDECETICALCPTANSFVPVRTPARTPDDSHVVQIDDDDDDKDLGDFEVDGPTAGLFGALTAGAGLIYGAYNLIKRYGWLVGVARFVRDPSTHEGLHSVAGAVPGQVGGVLQSAASAVVPLGSGNNNNGNIPSAPPLVIQMVEGRASSSTPPRF